MHVSIGTFGIMLEACAACLCCLSTKPFHVSHFAFCSLTWRKWRETHTLPALPIWMISPVGLSSPLRTGQLTPSALTNSNSSFVPMILNELLSGSMVPKRGISCLNRFLSEVRRSRSTVVGEVNLTVEASLSIFLRYKEAMTVEGVW